MRDGATRSINISTKDPALWLLAAALCLCPVGTRAAGLDPTDTTTGTGALGSENGGFGNTADGYYALYYNTTGYANTASGYAALFSNIGGTYNTASGYYALYYNTTGSSNTGSGFGAIFANTTGNFNTASGYNALNFNSVGNNNAGLGYRALYANTSGSSNVAIGGNALYAMQGTNNIALGYNAGKLTTSGNSNIYIGHAGLNGSESKVTRIGQLQTKVFIAGIRGVPLSGATVVVGVGGQLGVVASSARYKNDIKSLADTADKLAQLRPVSFRYKTEPDATHYGLIAEEVDKVMPELVVRDEKNRPESVQYQELIPLLLQQWKAQRELNARQEAENVRGHELIERQAAALKEQEGRLARQEAQLTELRHMLATRRLALDGPARGVDVK
jgi:trimeric autotransporter adhesin